LALEKESVLTVVDDFMPLAATLMGRLRLQMRMYIKQKFYLSVLKAFIIGGMFAALSVDLWIVWGLLTFFMNFMPMGSAVSTFAPMPFVILDPTKGYVIMAACFLCPVLVHNFVGNVIEPRVFASTLNLHPVTVLLAMTFWVTLWGVMGALVCVPITAMMRVCLSNDHPYSAFLTGFLEGRLPSPSAQASIASLLVATYEKQTCQKQDGNSDSKGWS